MAPMDKPIVDNLPPIDVEKKPDIGNVDKPLVEPEKPVEKPENIRVEPVVPNPPSDEKDNSKKDSIKDGNTNTKTNTETNTKTETNKGKTSDSYDVIYF